MSLEQAFQISLVEFLARLGHRPTKVNGQKFWYLSPYRNERTASFNVNMDKNRWYDFGAGEGGSIIKLARRSYRTEDISVILRMIEQQIPAPAFVLNKPPCEKKQEMAVWDNVSVESLSSYPLLDYLKKRGIPVYTARTYCREVSYERNCKRYYAIGFRNDSGGYELRNPYFKGCMGKKDITFIKAKDDPNKDILVCRVFEGIFDFLSYLTLRRMGIYKESEDEQADYIILNSVSNLSKATTHLKEYDRVYTYLDNDEAGKKGTRLIADMRNDLFDMAITYGAFNDVNDYLVSVIKDGGEKHQ